MVSRFCPRCTHSGRCCRCTRGRLLWPTWEQCGCRLSMLRILLWVPLLLLWLLCLLLLRLPPRLMLPAG